MIGPVAGAGRVWGIMLVAAVRTGPLSPVLAYGLAVGAVLLTFVLRYALEGVLGEQAIFLVFVLPVVLVVLVGGRGPAMVAGMLSLVAGLALLAPEHRFADQTVAQSIVF